MNRVSIGSDNGLSPIRRQAIIWMNAGLLWIGPLGTKFSEISIKNIFIHENASENTVCEKATILSRGGGGWLADYDYSQYHVVAASIPIPAPLSQK